MPRSSRETRLIAEQVVTVAGRIWNSSTGGSRTGTLHNQRPPERLVPRARQKWRLQLPGANFGKLPAASVPRSIAVSCDTQTVIDTSPKSVLVVHLCLTLISLLATGAIRRRARRGANPSLLGEALELAYVNEGPRLVLFTSLAELGRRGLARSAPMWRGGGIERVDGPELPTEAPPLLPALLDALQEHDRVPDLLANERVATEVDEIGIRLVRRGWYLSARTQTRVKRFAPSWLVAIWCLLLFALTLPHFSEPGRAVQALGLLGLGIFAAIATYMIVDLPPSTRAGRAALQQTNESTGAESLMYEIATGGEAAFWKNGADFASSAGASPNEMSPFPRLMTHRGALKRGWLHDH